MKNYQPELVFENDTYELLFKLRKSIKGLDRIVYDEEAFKRGDIGYRRDEMTSLFHVYHDDALNPNVIRFWAKRGLKKEVFGNDGKYGFDAPHEYSVFTPLGMDMNKKYAMIYFSHGGGQPIEWAETYGYNRLAASERYIAVYAQNGGRSNDEVETEFPRILNELRERGYPIDWERVYVAGFSSGCSSTAALAYTYPDKIAAIACIPDGSPFKSMSFHKYPGVYAKEKGFRVPGVFIGGTADAGCFPKEWVTGYTGNDLGAGTAQNAVMNLNIWMKEIAQRSSFTPLTLEGIIDLLVNAADPIEKEYGLKFDRTFHFRTQGTNWFGGEYYGDDHTPVMRFTRAAGVPHMVWESAAGIAWDYLKHFRRDMNTKESRYDSIACWGES